MVLTARDVKRGTEAVEKLKASGFSNVVFHLLDVTDPATIASLADFLKTQFGKIDILVFVPPINYLCIFLKILCNLFLFHLISILLTQ